LDRNLKFKYDIIICRW